MKGLCMNVALWNLRSTPTILGPIRRTRLALGGVANLYSSANEQRSYKQSQEILSAR